jgi:AcrR family transcriptional regulator
MQMTLRERRRRQTARDIQLATLNLSLRDGYDQLTTEAISAEAGISTRTFFNYYPNKQAAVLGPAVTLSDVAPDWFAASGAPLTADIARLLVDALLIDPPDRMVLRTILRVIESHPALPNLFRKRLDDMALVLLRLLLARLGAGSETEARLVAEVSVQTLAHAVTAWAVDDAMPLTEIGSVMAGVLQRVGLVLRDGPGQAAHPPHAVA